MSKAYFKPVKKLLMLPALTASFTCTAKIPDRAPQKHGNHFCFHNVSTGKFVFYDTTHRFTCTIKNGVFDAPMLAAWPYPCNMTRVVYGNDPTTGSHHQQMVVSF